MGRALEVILVFLWRAVRVGAGVYQFLTEITIDTGSLAGKVSCSTRRVNLDRRWTHWRSRPHDTSMTYLSSIRSSFPLIVVKSLQSPSSDVRSLDREDRELSQLAIRGYPSNRIPVSKPN